MASGQSLYDWCMENGEWGQQIIQEWVGKDSDDNNIDIKCITKSSGSKVQWKCSKEHIWIVNIAHRTYKRSWCPYCTNRKLLIGFNDLETWCKNNGEIGSELLQEWDYNKNKISPSEEKYYSTEKVHWKCLYGHEWEAPPRRRILEQTGCPVCTTQVIQYGFNDLETWCKNNGEIGIRLLQEWDYNKNEIDIKNISPYSSKSAFWICRDCKNEYSSRIISRTKHGCGCKKCADRRNGQKLKEQRIVIGDNDLYTWCQNNGEFGQQLLDEWIGIDENNKEVDIHYTAKATPQKVKWKCNREHEWVTSVVNRTSQQTMCPYCSNRKILKGFNDLETWCNYNEEYGKKIFSEWVGKDEEGNNISIDSITKGNQKRVMWKCKKGHSWVASIYDRTSNKSNCPYCNIKGTSYPEQFLYRSLLQIYPQTISRGRFKGIEYDITIPEEKTCIEYSGYVWHEEKIERDKMKANICKEYNVRFIQIYAHKGQIDTEDIFDKNYIVYKTDRDIDTHNKQLVEILDHILKSFGHSISEIDIEKAQTEAFNFMHGIDDKSDKLDDYNF